MSKKVGRYRILQQNGNYWIQKKRWYGWADCDLGVVSDLANYYQNYFDAATKLGQIKKNCWEANVVYEESA